MGEIRAFEEGWQIKSKYISLLKQWANRGNEGLTLLVSPLRNPDIQMKEAGSHDVVAKYRGRLELKQMDDTEALSQSHDTGERQTYLQSRDLYIKQSNLELTQKTRKKKIRAMSAPVRRSGRTGK